MSQQKPMRGDSSIQLPDGRRLGYAEYGAPNGSPVLFFHGAPGSSHIHSDMGEIATQRKLRLIAVDRPGYGVSDPKADRTFLSWADDIEFLMDALKIKQFAIIGFSCGGPYPLSCAYRLPDRVGKIALVSSLAPLSAPGVMRDMSPMVSGMYELAQTDPDELRKTFAAIASTASALLSAVSASAGDWDKQVLLDRANEFNLEYMQTLRSGTEGLASDIILNSAKWGFPLAEIKNKVHLWSGTMDQNAPPAMMHYLAERIPDSHTHLLQNEGHFVLYGHWNEVLKSVE
jgi:pimeloyl-ACP methyl ester carboxylesterase